MQTKPKTTKHRRKKPEMNNVLLTAVLGIGLAACCTASYMVYSFSEKQDHINEEIHYAEAGLDESTMFGGFSAEEMAEGYDPPGKKDGKYIINVPMVNQFPELPVGCEIASEAAVLQFLGFDADKITLAEDYIPKNDDIYDDIHHFLYGPDPAEYFVGDPFTWGYGCYSPVIADSMNRYFLMHGSGNKAVDMKDLTGNELDMLLEAGVPVIVWASQDMEPFVYKDSSCWTVKKNGKNIRWLGNSHTLVLVGYDREMYYFMDCGGKTDITPYKRELFISRWEENGSQAVAVKRA